MREEKDKVAVQVPPYLLLIHSDKLACQASPLRLSLHVGVVRSRWASWSSTPVAGRVAGRGGFDSHPLSPTFGTHVWVTVFVSIDN